MQGEELYIVYMYIVITGSTDEFLAIKFNLINETISLFRDVFFFFVILSTSSHKYIIH